ncbi:hypothetical protein BK673_16200 [Pseudomonas fluorescens]|uniref:DUF2971 domain-containing protein n=1 Tax=Pseudomonas fluorescens TaxID=294 RepID=A0A423P4C4_PSEFL|nr:DUF2971 domain-containing protein [Pseudomonas fluorescens]ROO08081.1 hypothetical protein BK673_16200 [Pseudomonas fluorescens]
MSFDEQIQSVLWDDLDTENDFPAQRPLLAHYTSVAVLDAMMGNNEIWFSNPLYMNDLEELRFGMVEGANAFRTSHELKAAFQDESAFDSMMEKFNKLFEAFETRHAFDTYIMCLAKHPPENNDGLLSMWRGYGAGGSGVAVVFDTAKIAVSDSSPFIIGAVTYGTREDRLAWIATKIKGLAGVIAGTTLSDEELFYIAYYWIERLKVFALFTKHSGFHEEQEWRIVYMSERDEDEKLKSMLGYAITPRGAVEPKLKFQVKPLEGMFGEHLSLENIVDRIILGPTTSSALAETSVRRMLGHRGKHGLAEKIVASSIPFRS